MNEHDLDKLSEDLNDETFFNATKALGDNLKTGRLAGMLSSFFFFVGDSLYGKNPSFEKFRALEVVARIPYQSMIVASYTLITLFYSDEEKAISLSKRKKYAEISQSNETMHVVVISSIVRKRDEEDFFMLTLLPLIAAFFYFWIGYTLFIFSKRIALEVNYLFENHALEQYSQFLKEHEQDLKLETLESPFLTQYGRAHHNQYDFIQGVRNDELLHRNATKEEIEKLK